MVTQLKGKHFLTTNDWTKQELDTVFETAFDLKRKFALEEPTRYLQDKTLFMMFFEQSTRTRNSMEAGIAQLGGHANYLDTSTMQISHGEVAKDTASVLSRYGHAIACRNCFWGIGNKYLNDMAKHSRVPIMSLQDDLYHPMQGIADLMTIIEKKKETKNLKVSIIWAYATSHKKPISVPLTQCLLFPRYGMDVTLAYPEGFEMPDWVIEEAKKNAEENGGSFRITHDMEEAYRDADVVIPKNWGSWSGKKGDVEISQFKDWKCTENLSTNLGVESSPQTVRNSPRPISGCFCRNSRALCFVTGIGKGPEAGKYPKG